MHRGDIVICALKGDFGKCRPAVVVQSDLFNNTHSSAIICPITTELIATPLFRIEISPSVANGLKKVSQVMADKIITIRKDKIAKVIGKLPNSDIKKIDNALKLMLSL